MKKQGIWLLAAVMILIAVSPLHLTNEYLRSNTFDRVEIQQGEDIQSVARRYTRDETRVRELQQAIIDVNDLNPDGSGLRQGQELLIPLLQTPETQVAEK